MSFPIASTNTSWPFVVQMRRSSSPSALISYCQCQTNHTIRSVNEQEILHNAFYGNEDSCIVNLIFLTSIQQYLDCYNQAPAILTERFLTQPLGSITRGWQRSAWSLWQKSRQTQTWRTDVAARWRSMQLDWWLRLRRHLSILTQTAHNKAKEKQQDTTADKSLQQKWVGGQTWSGEAWTDISFSLSGQWDSGLCSLSDPRMTSTSPVNDATATSSWLSASMSAMRGDAANGPDDSSRLHATDSSGMQLYNNNTWQLQQQTTTTTTDYNYNNTCMHSQLLPAESCTHTW